METKYGNLVKHLSFQEGRGGANARELVFVSGEEMAGFDFNFIIGVYDQTGDWAPGRGAHSHTFDEFSNVMSVILAGWAEENADQDGSDAS